MFAPRRAMVLGADQEVVLMSENRTRGIQFGAPRVDNVPDGTGIDS